MQWHIPTMPKPGTGADGGGVYGQIDSNGWIDVRKNR